MKMSFIQARRMMEYTEVGTISIDAIVYNFIQYLQSWFCNACGNSGGDLSSMINHMYASHLNSRPYRCDCTQEFRESQALIQHVKREHIFTRYVCNNCHQVFSSQLAILLHVDNHRRNVGRI